MPQQPITKRSQQGHRSADLVVRCQGRILLMIHPGEPAWIETVRTVQAPSAQQVLIDGLFSLRAWVDNASDDPWMEMGHRIAQHQCPIRGHATHELDAERLRLHLDRARAGARRPLNIDVGDVVSRDQA